MTDKTTEGITATPEEVEAVLLNLCGYHLSERDPVFRYTVLTREQVLYDALVTAIKRERGRALAELVEKGHKLTEVAELTGLGSRQRVQRLIQLAKVEQAVAEAEAASRQFDQRMAAVEATLDEVVSGFIPVVPANEASLETSPAAKVEARVNEDFDEVTAHAEETFAKDTADPNEVPDLWAEDGQAFNQPTQIIPTLATLMPPPVEEAPWWRRSRDTGAA